MARERLAVDRRGQMGAKDARGGVRGALDGRPPLTAVATTPSSPPSVYFQTFRSGPIGRSDTPSASELGIPPAAVATDVVSQSFFSLNEA